MIICKIDNTEHETIDSLHKHLRKFKIKQSSYYEEYFPKNDLLTGKKIEFKSYDQYFSTFFSDKNNMKKWFKENPDKSLELGKKMLELRVKKKGLKIAPSYLELVTSGLPSISFFESNGSYKKIANELGCKCKYDYSIEDLSFEERELEIIIDTRETKPFKFSRHKTIRRKLDFGDYALDGNENGIVVERKSLMDFISSFVSDYVRVKKEFERAKQNGAYIIVVCEESLATAMSFNFIPYVRRYTKVRPDVVFHNVRELMTDYDCQFVFCNGVAEATKTVEKIFTCKNDLKKIDIQYLISKKKW